MNGWWFFLVCALICFYCVRYLAARDAQLLVVVWGLGYLSLSLAALAQYPWGLWAILLIVAWVLWRLISAAHATIWRRRSPAPRGWSPEGTTRLLSEHSASPRFRPRPVVPVEAQQSWREAFGTVLLYLSAIALVCAANKLPLTIWWPARFP
jgi:hypothetical protein